MEIVKIAVKEAFASKMNTQSWKYDPVTWRHLSGCGHYANWAYTVRFYGATYRLFREETIRCVQGKTVMDEGWETGSKFVTG